MDRKTRVAIVGYGNVGKGVHKALSEGRNPDMSLVGIISRDPERVKREVQDIPIFNSYDRDEWYNGVPADVAVLCGGSKKDLPVQGSEFVQFFNTVDSFDTHKKIPHYWERMDVNARLNGHVSIISVGWDPGTFSVERVYADAFIPGVKPQAFYGLPKKGGLSMGHSDAIRKIDGVMDARQYTHAIPEAIERVKLGEDLKPEDRMWRQCYVVVEEGADIGRIKKEIENMPEYFEEYKTLVIFVTADKLYEEHSAMFHDGMVLAVGETGDGNKALIEYRCEWRSNPEATGSIMVAYARAAHRLNKEGKSGAFTVLDVPPAYVSPHLAETLREKFM